MDTYNRTLSEALNDCLERMAEGQILEDCLDDYPQYRDALQSMLQTGLLVQQIEYRDSHAHDAYHRQRQRLQAVVANRRRRPMGFRLPGLVTLAASLVLMLLVVYLLSNLLNDEQTSGGTTTSTLQPTVTVTITPSVTPTVEISLTISPASPPIDLQISPVATSPPIMPPPTSLLDNTGTQEVEDETESD